MEFKLVLVAKTPDTFILNAEQPLEGLAFLEKASACLRRSLDTQTLTRHVTLGNIAQYTVTVPQAIAIESGWFTEKNTRYLPCEADILKKYIFYGAAMNNGPAGRACYPYLRDQITLHSYIDELAILTVWRNRGYPETFTVDFAGVSPIPIVPEAGDVDNPDPGDMVLDDLLDQGSGSGDTMSDKHCPNMYTV